MKLQLFLSHNGIASRRDAFDRIMEGKVKVNGRKVTEPSTEIDPAVDRVSFEGFDVVVKTCDYIVLNKPQGYVTTCEGQFDQKTVMQLLPEEFQHLRPVGRLDKDTEGLLLLTNDGEMANRLTHPSFNVDKTYYVKVRYPFTEKDVEQLEAGVIIEEQRTLPAKVQILKAAEDESEIEITIHEGKKHQVRNMMDAVGHPVIQLRRLTQGPIQLGNLRSADWRRLTEEELQALAGIARSQNDGAGEGHRNKYIDSRREARSQRGAPSREDRPGRERPSYGERRFEGRGERGAEGPRLGRERRQFRQGPRREGRFEDRAEREPYRERHSEGRRDYRQEGRRDFRERPREGFSSDRSERRPEGRERRDFGREGRGGFRSEGRHERRDEFRAEGRREFRPREAREGRGERFQERREFRPREQREGRFEGPREKSWQRREGPAGEKRGFERRGYGERSEQRERPYGERGRRPDRPQASFGPRYPKPNFGFRKQEGQEGRGASEGRRERTSYPRHEGRGRGEERSFGRREERGGRRERQAWQPREGHGGRSGRESSARRSESRGPGRFRSGAPRSEYQKPTDEPRE